MAPTPLTSTTLSAAVNAQNPTLALTAVTNVLTTVNNATGGTSTFLGQITALYIDKELIYVVSVNTTAKTVFCLRGVGGTLASHHASGATVIIGPPIAFLDYDPAGLATNVPPPGTFMAPPSFTPWVNQRTGDQWIVGLNNLWGPGPGNVGSSGTPVVASAAQAITSNAISPTGPMVHVTGTTVLKTINLPAGFPDGGQVTLIFDGSGLGLTWDATGNINVAGTSTTAGSAVTFTWDQSISKWIPSRLA